jgi:hypothetical protein
MTDCLLNKLLSKIRRYSATYVLFRVTVIYVAYIKKNEGCKHGAEFLIHHSMFVIKVYFLHPLRRSFTF